MTEVLLVQREIHIAAPPATVFAFLTDPEKIVSWVGAEATTDVQPGGLYLSKARVARRAASSGRWYRSTASPTALVGREAKWYHPDRA
jgi:uncharacterized protein YndB with AHSA1/START domain